MTRPVQPPRHQPGTPPAQPDPIPYRFTDWAAI